MFESQELREFYKKIISLEKERDYRGFLCAFCVWSFEFIEWIDIFLSELSGDFVIR